MMVSLKKMGGRVWSDFLSEYDKLSGDEGKMQWKFWTKQWLEILENVGRSYGYNVHVEKPARIDMSWYDPAFYDPIASIEVETNEDTVFDSEVPNLLYSSAKIKILLTYSTKEREAEFVGRIIEYLRRRRALVKGDEFLAIFVVYHRERGTDWFDEFHAHLLAPILEGEGIRVNEQLLGETRKIK